MGRKYEVSKEQAEHVLASVAALVGEPAGSPNGPALYPAEHEEMPNGCWSIAFEGWGGETPWTLMLDREQLPEGVYVEAMYSWCLGIYPVKPLMDWARP